MRIGIDIDGVLTNMEEWQLEYGSKYLYNNKYGLNINNKAYFSGDAFEIEQDLDDRLWAEGIFDYIKKPARNYANEVIKKLRENGNEIYIITARNGNIKYVDNINQEIMEKIVLEWLRENGIYYDKIFFTPEDKVETCLNNNIDVMIEDSPTNIKDISKQIPVICFNAGYNEHCNFENVTRCYTWYDVLDKLDRGCVKNDFKKN